MYPKSKPYAVEWSWDYESKFCSPVGNSNNLKRRWIIIAFLSDDCADARGLSVTADAYSDADTYAFTESSSERYTHART